MASSTVNVVRYTALFSGVAYGWFHHRSLQATHDEHKLAQAVHSREKLIVEAKEAWNRKQNTAKGMDIITDPEHPKFDLEALISSLEKSS